jgi:uncharacterized membrane protein
MNAWRKEKVNFYTSKTLSGVGALLVFVSFLAVPFTPSFGGSFIALIGLILMLIGVKGLADYYKEAGIFNNMLYGTIAGIVGIVVAVAVAIGVVINSLSSFLYKVFPGWNGDWTSLSGMYPTASNLTLSDVAPFITAALAVFVALFVFAIVVALLYRRSLSSLKDKSAIGLFGSTGTVLLIGAVLTIILIGYILIWIGILMLAIAFFELREQPPQSMPAAQTTMPPQTAT